MESNDTNFEYTDDPGYFESCSYKNCLIECNEFPEDEFPRTFIDGAAMMYVDARNSCCNLYHFLLTIMYYF